MQNLMHDEDALAAAMLEDAENVPTFGQTLTHKNFRTGHKPATLRGKIQGLLKREARRMTAAEIADELMTSPESIRQSIRFAPRGMFKKTDMQKQGRDAHTFYEIA